MYEHEMQMAIEDGAEALKNMRRVLADAAAVVERYIANYQEAAGGEDGTIKPEDVLSWAANHAASNVLGNCRLDLLVIAAARIAGARARLAQS